MMPSFAAQLQGLADAIVQADVDRQLSQDERRRMSTRKRRNAPRKAPAADPAEKRAEYQAAALAALKHGVPLNSTEVGAAMGVLRSTAFRRLRVLEALGLVARSGYGVKTKWRLA